MLLTVKVTFGATKENSEGATTQNEEAEAD